MITFARILVPVDFSAFSGHALAYAAVLGRWYRSQIRVLHVYSPWIPPVSLSPHPTASLPVAPPLRDDEIQEEVRRFAEPLVAAGLSPTVSVEVADYPARAIVRAAEEQPADLLIMGTHGRGGVERLVLGSVTEKVLRLVRCPVLTIPPPTDAPEAEPGTFKTIVCAVDFGPSTARALEHALSLAKEADAQLILLHVLEALTDISVLGDTVGFSASDYLRDLERDARQRLEELLPDDARIWCRPDARVVSGKPYREILRVADETRARLIVMGVQGRGVVDLLLFGSTTHHVIRRAQCPVLTVRAAEE